MGSFANSLHVRTNDLAAVAAALRKSLLGEGFHPTEEQLDADARWGMSATLRGIHLSKPRQGWVAILENDPLSSVALATELSQQLQTYAIQLFVNDSDSWHYQLFYRGRQIDTFDSAGDEAAEWDEDESNEDSLDALANGGLAGIERAMRGKAQEFEAFLTAEMPPDVLAIHGKMRSGQASQEEMQAYMEWMSAEMPKHMAAMQRLVADAMQGLGLGGSTKGGPTLEEEERELHPHVQRLTPLLVPDASRSLLLELLGRQAVFAEETLAEFLPLVGIAPVYAHLSYRYLEEISESELASQSVEMAEHLRFRSGFADADES